MSQEKTADSTSTQTAVDFLTDPTASLLETVPTAWNSSPTLQVSAQAAIFFPYTATIATVAIFASVSR